MVLHEIIFDNVRQCKLINSKIIYELMSVQMEFFFQKLSHIFYPLYLME